MKQLRGQSLKKFKKDTEKHKKSIVLVAENIQYARNVASIFRISDSAKVEKIILTGISQKPPFGKELKKVSRMKELSVPWEYSEHAGKSINKYVKQGYQVIGLEITDQSKDYRTFDFPDKICLVIGNETYGITKNSLERINDCVFIPMYGKGASLNVSTAYAIVLFKIIE